MGNGWRGKVTEFSGCGETIGCGDHMANESTPTVYIETSIVSYLTARPASNLLAAAWQEATVDWWDTHRPNFEESARRMATAVPKSALQAS